MFRKRSLLRFVLGVTLFSSALAHAATVAFVEYEVLGRRAQISHDSPYAHVLLHALGGYLHSFPGRPVEIIASAEDIVRTKGVTGQVVYLTNPDIPEPTEAQLKPFFDHSFDNRYRADQPEHTYCALVVRDILESLSPLLNLELSPMNFAAPNWTSWSTPLPVGERGTSPGKLFKQLLERGWRESEAPVCADQLRQWKAFDAMPIKYVAHSPLHEAARDLGLERNPAPGPRSRP